MLVLVNRSGALGTRRRRSYDEDPMQSIHDPGEVRANCNFGGHP
jgi:hypothetical protein